ncbi:MAG: hypothetical protein AB7F67_24240 [Rhodospirillaceae bacterium]
MRRGLIEWSRDEVPEAVLAARVARLQAAMAKAGLDAVLLYTSFTRPAWVSHFTQFVPYWSEGFAVVLPDGLPAIALSMSKRVQGWIAEVSRAGEVMCAPQPGRAAAAIVRRRFPDAVRVGVADLPALPTGAVTPAIAALGAETVVDATAACLAARLPADDAERALGRTAAMLAKAAIDVAWEGRPADSAAFHAAAERAARESGCEEVQTLFAPDLGADGRLRRIEGTAPLADRFAVQVSLGYKGVWSRIGRSLSRGTPPAAWPAAAAGFEEAAATLRADASPAAALEAALARHKSGMLERWCVEGCAGGLPLSVLASNEKAGRPSRHAGAPVVLTARLRTDDGWWLRSDGFALPG